MSLFKSFLDAFSGGGYDGGLSGWSSDDFSESCGSPIKTCCSDTACEQAGTGADDEFAEVVSSAGGSSACEETVYYDCSETFFDGGSDGGDEYDLGAVRGYAPVLRVFESVGFAEERLKSEFSLELIRRMYALVAAFPIIGFSNLWRVDFEGQGLIALNFVSDLKSYRGWDCPVKDYWKRIFPLDLGVFFSLIFGFDPFVRLKGFVEGSEEFSLQCAALLGDLLLSMEIRRKNRFLKAGEINGRIASDGSREVQSSRLRKIFWTGMGVPAAVTNAYGSKVYEAMVFLTAGTLWCSYFDPLGVISFPREQVVLGSWLIGKFGTEHCSWVSEQEYVIKVPELASVLGLLEYIGFNQYTRHFGTVNGKCSLRKEYRSHVIVYSSDVLKLCSALAAFVSGFDAAEYLAFVPEMFSTVNLNRWEYDKELGVGGSKDYWLLLFLFFFENRMYYSMLTMIDSLWKLTGFESQMSVMDIDRFVEVMNGNWNGLGDVDALFPSHVFLT